MHSGRVYFDKAQVSEQYKNAEINVVDGGGISPLKSFQKSDSNTLVDQCLGGWVGEQQHHLVVSFSYVDTSNFIDNNNESWKQVAAILIRNQNVKTS